MKIQEIYTHFLKSTGVCTDTRQITPNCLFFALKGENFNGNEFAKTAIKQGAALAIVDQKEYANDQCVLVDSVLETLQELAKYHRAKLDIPVVAVTGSNGKTTCKELLNAVLSQKFSVGYTKGNLNNHIGVPLTLLSLNSSHQVALIEMGDNHPQEVEFLCQIAQPTHGFVTNVGKDHLEGFGSFENNVLAKKEIFDYLGEHQGVGFADAKNDLLLSMITPGLKVVRYGLSGDYSHISFIESNPTVVFRGDNECTYHTELFGGYNFSNIELVWCIGKHFGVNSKDIGEAIQNYHPDNNRSQVVKTAKNTLVMDAYNANPSSVAEALNSFAQMETSQSKWIILGDMFELGSYSDQEHLEIGKMALDMKVENVFLVGENYAKMHGPNERVFRTKEEVELRIKKIAPEGAIILLKGSRGMRLETFKDIL